MWIRKLICKWFGHFYSHVAVLVFDIKLKPVNVERNGDPELRCWMCKEKFTVHQLRKQNKWNKESS